MVPPTLREVCQLVLQAVLHELEHDGDDGGEPPVPEDESLAPVSHEVGHNEDIHFVLDVVPGILGIVSVINPAVAAVIFLSSLLAEISVHVLQEFPGIARCLEQDVDEEKLVEHSQGEG